MSNLGSAPRRLVRRDGASVVRHHAAIDRMEIPMPKPGQKSAKKRSPKSKPSRASATKPTPLTRTQSGAGKSADATSKQAHVIAMLEFADRHDDCRDDAGNRLATAFGAWLPFRRGAQETEVEARLDQSGWPSCLPHRWRITAPGERTAIQASPGLKLMPRVKVGPAPPTLDVELARLRDLDAGALRAGWQNVFRRQPSPHLQRHLLFRVLAYRLQADQLGDFGQREPTPSRQCGVAGGRGQTRGG